MGQNIAKAFEKVGDTGNVVIEESQVLIDEVETSEGMTLDRGYVSPYFVTDAQRLLSELKKPRVLVTDQKISDAYDIINLLEELLKTKQPVFIVADDVTGEALQTLVQHTIRADMKERFGARELANVAYGAAGVCKYVNVGKSGSFWKSLGELFAAISKKAKRRLEGFNAQELANTVRPFLPLSAPRGHRLTRYNLNKRQMVTG